MSRRTWKPSLTVSAVIEDAGRFLLVEEEADGKMVYNQPGGHWERGESFVEACAREVLEESAYVFVPTNLLGVFSWRHPGSGTTFVRMAFTGEIRGHEAARALDTQIRQAIWLTLDEVRELAPRHRSPLVMACIERYLAGVRYPLDVLGHF